MREVVAAIRAAQMTVAQGARQAGCDRGYLAQKIWRQVRDDVIARDMWCAYCGATQSLDVHHIVPKASGGTSRPEIAFGWPNLITLCRVHHAYAHSHWDWANRLGYRLRNGATPGQQRVWRGAWVMLTADGGITPWEPNDGQPQDIPDLTEGEPA